MTVGFVVGICAAGVLPAVIISEVINASTTVSTSDTFSTNSITTVSSNTSSGSNSSTTTNCPINVCFCTTSYTMIASGFYGTERVDLNCTQTLSNLTGLITVQKTVSASYANQFHTFWSGTITQSFTNTSTQILYSWKIVSGQTISSSGFPYYIEAQYQLQGINQTVANDTYSITTQSSCNGQLVTCSGHF